MSIPAAAYSTGERLLREAAELLRTGRPDPALRLARAAVKAVRAGLEWAAMDREEAERAGGRAVVPAEPAGQSAPQSGDSPKNRGGGLGQGALAGSATGPRRAEGG